MSDFNEFWKEEACGITFDYPHEGGQFAWDHQQQKIDEAIKILNDIYPYEYDLDTGIKINKIKELLK